MIDARPYIMNIFSRHTNADIGWWVLLRGASLQWWLVVLRCGPGPRSRRWAPDPVGIVEEKIVARIVMWLQICVVGVLLFVGVVGLIVSIPSIPGLPPVLEGWRCHLRQCWRWHWHRFEYHYCGRPRKELSEYLRTTATHCGFEFVVSPEIIADDREKS